jgi:hypothetical protein
MTPAYAAALNGSIVAARAVATKIGSGSEAARAWEDETNQVWERAWHQERALQSSLLRDVLAYRSAPLAVQASWLHPKVKELARAIYQDQVFTQMPRLAEILKEAGCRDLGMLVHCRMSREHVRGCWAIDALLGLT